MRAILYDNHSSEEVVNKNLTQIADISYDAYNDLDIERPVLILSDMPVIDIDKCNYCYIEEFERYYFCIPTLNNNGIYTLMCEVDPLMSFAADILNLKVIVDKNEYDINPYLNDGSYITEEREKVEVISYSNGFNDTGRYILIAAGG